MKTALESHGGLKGCRIAVVKIDPVAENASPPNKIPGISLLNDFAFTKIKMEFVFGVHIM